MTNAPTPLSLSAQTARSWLLVAVVAFIAHFLLFTQFGLYEDDYIYTLPRFGMSFSEWSAGVRDAILHPIQARPLNHAMRRTLFAVTLQGNTLDLAYLASWAMVSLNAFLVYRVMARRFAPGAGGAAALIYLLHPADNARQIIMHQTDIHFGAMLLLISLNLFEGRRPIAAWIVGAASLVNYESFYLPLLVVPFVLSPDPLKGWRSTLRHVVIWAVIIGSVAVTRYLLGEDRASAAAESASAVAAKVARALVVGPMTSLRLLVSRPFDALAHLTPLLTMAGAVIGIISFRLMTPAPPPVAHSPSHPSRFAWPIIGGLIGLSLTYLFAFRPGAYPPVLSIGRLTALHAPGILCTAFAAAALFAWLQSVWSRRSALAVAGVVTLSSAFGAMGAFAVEIQLTEYAAHWTAQKEFWRQVMAASQDAADGDCILVDVEGDEKVIPITPGFPRFGTVNYPPQALRYFAAFPPEWKNPPRVYGVWADAPFEVKAEGVLLKTPPYFGPADQPVLRDGNFIFLRAENGLLQRINGPVEIRGNKLLAKALGSSGSGLLQTTPLYRALMETRSGRDWQTIRNSCNYPP